MKKVEKIINDLFFEFESRGADLKRMNAKDQQIIETISNEKDYIIWINDYGKLAPHFINDKGTKYYGYSSNDLRKQGFKLYEKLIHPDHFNDVHKTVSLLTTNPRDTFEMTYRVKEKSGDWRWTYSITRALNFDRTGSPVLAMAIVFDIADTVQLSYFKKDDGQKDLNFEVKNRSLYNELTKRERQILNLIASEKTSLEIAKSLKIEASTVDTHRKRIIKKLGVKSSLGLVKYSFHFE